MVGPCTRTSPTSAFRFVWQAIPWDDFAGGDGDGVIVRSGDREGGGEGGGCCEDAMRLVMEIASER